MTTTCVLQSESGGILLTRSKYISQITFSNLVQTMIQGDMDILSRAFLSRLNTTYTAIKETVACQQIHGVDSQRYRLHLAFVVLS